MFDIEFNQRGIFQAVALKVIVEKLGIKDEILAECKKMQLHRESSINDKSGLSLAAYIMEGLPNE